MLFIPGKKVLLALTEYTGKGNMGAGKHIQNGSPKSRNI